MISDELVDAFARAVEAERDARRTWERLLVKCGEQNIPCSRLALYTFRARVGRWPKADERAKEADRLRKSRQRVTARHGKARDDVASEGTAALGSTVGGRDKMRLRRRQIVEKTVTEDYADAEECIEPESPVDADEAATDQVDEDERADDEADEVDDDMDEDADDAA